MNNQTIIPHPLSENLKKARGKHFGKLIRQVYEETSPALVEQAKLIIAREGNLSIISVGILALKFNLHLKHCFEFLEWQKILSSGTYQRLLDRGLKATQVLEKAKSIDNF
ncbi:MAG: hypothetical protein WBB28_01415 [Crinalium sp.]